MLLAPAPAVVFRRLRLLVFSMDGKMLCGLRLFPVLLVLPELQVRQVLLGQLDQRLPAPTFLTPQRLLTDLILVVRFPRGLSPWGFILSEMVVGQGIHLSLAILDRVASSRPTANGGNLMQAAVL